MVHVERIRISRLQLSVSLARFVHRCHTHYSMHEPTDTEKPSMGSDGADRRPRPARFAYVESKLTSLKRYRRSRATPGEVPGMCDVPAVAPDERESHR